MDVHEVLVAGRNHYEKHGEPGPLFGRPSMGPCAVVSLDRAVEDGVPTHWAVAALAAELGADSWLCGQVVGKWHDDPQRTKDEVLALFDAAIAETAPPPPDPELSVPSEQPVGV